MGLRALLCSPANNISALKKGTPSSGNPEKSMKLENGQREFPQKTKIHNLRRKKIFGKNCFGHFLEHTALYLSAKNQKKLMKQFCTKSKKPYF